MWTVLQFPLEIFSYFRFCDWFNTCSITTSSGKSFDLS